MNNISSSPISLSWPVWCFRNNSSIEIGNSSDKSYYNTMQHNSRGQTALNSRWVLPVPGRKWHWAPSLSYFILAENRDYHHFIFGTSIPHRVSCKLISVFLFSFSAWIPLGLLSSLARNSGHSNSRILPQSLSHPCCGVSLDGIWFHHGWPHADAHNSVTCVLMCEKKTRKCTCIQQSSVTILTNNLYSTLFSFSYVKNGPSLGQYSTNTIHGFILVNSNGLFWPIYYFIYHCWVIVGLQYKLLGQSSLRQLANTIFNLGKLPSSNIKLLF